MFLKFIFVFTLAFSLSSKAEYSCMSLMQENHPHTNLLTRFSFGVLLRPLGGKKILEIYERMREQNLYQKGFWDAVVEELNVNYAYDSNAISLIPKTEPLVVVANHHLGVLDSVGLAHLLSQVRSDFKIMMVDKFKDASVLRGIHEQLIYVPDRPIPGVTSPREQALAHLKGGGAIILFPSGFLAVPEKSKKFAFDPHWKSGALTFAEQAKALILPVYFDSQNSTLYRALTKYLPATKHAMLVREALLKDGQDILVSIGKPLKLEEIPGTTLKEKSNVLRAIVYGMGLQEMFGLKPYSQMTLSEKRLVDEQKETMYKYLPESLKPLIPQIISNLFYPQNAP